MVTTGTDRDGKPFVLYDADGKPILPSDRHADTSTLGHVYTFASIIRGASNTYYHLWDEAMRQSRENALAMRRDTFLMSLLEERKDATSSLKWHLEPDNPRDPRQAAVAAALEKMLQATPDLISLQHYLLEALWYGRYGAFLTWDWAELDLPQVTQASSAIPGSGGGGSAMQKCLVLKHHYPLHGDKIGHFHDHTPYLKIHSSEHDKIKGIPEIVVTTEGFGLALGGEWRERVLLHYHNRLDQDFFEAEMAEAIHGQGIRSVIAFYEFLRKDFISAAIDAIERFGLGIVTIKYDQSNSKAKAEAEDLARNMSRRSVITVPVSKNGSESAGGVEIIEGPMAGVQFLLALRDYFDDKIERYIVGQHLSDGVGGAGRSSGGLAAFAAKTQHRRFSGDAHRLAETMAGSKLRPGLVSIAKQHTFPWADFPVRWVMEIEDPESERKLGAASMLVNLDVPLIKDEVRSVGGFRKPAEDDEVVSMAAIQQAMGGGIQQPGMGGQPQPGQQGGDAELAALLGDMGGDEGGGGGDEQPMQFIKDNYEKLRFRRGEALSNGNHAAVAKYDAQMRLAARAYSAALRYNLDPTNNQPPQNPQPEPVVRKQVPKTQVMTQGPSPMPKGTGAKSRREQRQQPAQPQQQPVAQPQQPQAATSPHEAVYGPEHVKHLELPEASSAHQAAPGSGGKKLREMQADFSHDPHASEAIENLQEYAGQSPEFSSWLDSQPVEHFTPDDAANVGALVRETGHYPYLKEVFRSGAGRDDIPGILDRHHEKVDEQKAFPVKNGATFQQLVFPGQQQHGQLTTPPIAYEKMPIPPQPGEDVYFRDEQGKVIAVGRASGDPQQWQTPQGYRIPFDMRNVAADGRVHRPESEGAYGVGFHHGDAKPPPGMEGMNAQQAREYADRAAAAGPYAHKTGGYLSHDDIQAASQHANRLEALESVGPQDQRYLRMGQRDAERLLPYGHSVEGMRAQDHADDQDRWAVKHAETLRKPLEQALQARGVPASLLQAGDGTTGTSRPNRISPSSQSQGYNGLGANTVAHTLLDEAYPQWRQHLEQGGKHGKAEFEKILGNVMDETFPPDQHSYDALMGLLDRTGNPHDVDREDYYLQKEKQTADGAKAIQGTHLAAAPPPEAYQVASLMQSDPKGARTLASNLADRHSSYYPGSPLPHWVYKEILRRVRAFDELPEAVRDVAAKHPQFTIYPNALLEPVLADKGTARDVKRWIQARGQDVIGNSHIDVNKEDPATIIAGALSRLAPVAAAFHAHQQKPTKFARDDAPDRYGLGDLQSGMDAPKPPTQPKTAPVKPPLAAPKPRQPVQPPKPAAIAANPVQPSAPQARQPLSEHNERMANVIFDFADTYDMPLENDDGSLTPAGRMFEYLKHEHGQGSNQFGLDQQADSMEQFLVNHDDELARSRGQNGYGHKVVLDSMLDHLKHGYNVPDDIWQPYALSLEDAYNKARPYGRSGTPLRMARRGLGSFTNPGGFAPDGEGTDYPSNFEHQGPVKPPQPWQLQARQPPNPAAAAKAGPAAPQGTNQPLPSPLPTKPLPASSYVPPDEEEQDFQDLPEHDPTGEPDAFADERIPPQLKGTGLSPEDVEEMRKELGDDGWLEFLQAVEEGEK